MNQGGQGEEMVATAVDLQSVTVFRRGGDGAAPVLGGKGGYFKLKPALINMVQQSPFCGKASEDANAHVEHFLEIYNTFTLRGVTQDAVHICLFPFSLLGKVKQWFYSNKEAVSTWEKCSNAFL
jgi:hypothetical protein